MNTIKKAYEEKITALTGLKPGIDFTLKSEVFDNLENHYKEIASLTLHPDEAGALAPIFKTIKLEIKAARDGEEMRADRRPIYVLCLHYSYEHPRGSNGYEIEYEGDLVNNEIYWIKNS